MTSKNGSKMHFRVFFVLGDQLESSIYIPERVSPEDRSLHIGSKNEFVTSTLIHQTICTLFVYTGTNVNATGLKMTNCSKPGYYSFNIGAPGSCYKYFPALAMQHVASTTCLQDNGRLISINSTDSINIVKALVG